MKIHEGQNYQIMIKSTNLFILGSKELYQRQQITKQKNTQTKASQKKPSTSQNYIHRSTTSILDIQTKIERPLNRLNLQRIKSRLQGRLTTSLKKRIFDFETLKKNGLFIIITKQLISKLIQNHLLGVYYKKINLEKYEKKFTDYLTFLFQNQSQQSINQLQRIHSFGIRSFFYAIFKINLFKILFQIQDYLIDYKTIFQGCVRVQKFRHCIATKNQFFQAISFDQACQEFIFLNQKIQNSINIQKQTFQTLLYFIFESSGLEQFRLIWKNQNSISKLSYVCLKRCICFLYLNSATFSIEMFNRILDNFKFIKNQMISRQTLNQFIKRKYLYIKNLEKIIFQALLETESYTRVQIKIARLIFLHIFNQQNIAFTNYQVGKICSLNQKSQKYINNLCSKFLQIIIRLEFPQYLVQHITFQLKRFRKLIIKNEKECIQNYQMLHPIVQSNIDQYMLFNTKFTRYCCPKMSTLMLLDVNIFEKEELIELHRKVKLSPDQVQQFKKFCCRSIPSIFNFPSKLDKLAQKLIF